MNDAISAAVRVGIKYRVAVEDMTFTHDHELNKTSLEPPLIGVRYPLDVDSEGHHGRLIPAA